MFINGRFVRLLDEENGGEAGKGAGGADNSGGEGEGGGSQPTLEELLAENKRLQDEKEAIASKNKELLGETKAAKEARRAAEQKAREEADAKAAKEGNFEQLYKSAQEQNSNLQAENLAIKDGIAKEKRDSTALNIATSLAEGANVKLLSEFIKPRLKHEDGETKVLDASGNLTVLTVQDLAKEIAADATYASLLKGSKAAGGGANDNNNNGGSAAKEITRSEFDGKSPAEKMKYIKAGGKVVD